jgi:hypothetical protein
MLRFSGIQRAWPRPLVVDIRRAGGLPSTCRFLASQEKLAFQGVDVIKWTYTVMPFGPTNGPATFISFVHDIDSIWKELTKSLGVSIDDNTNTRIIVDDIVSWADNFRHSLIYMHC